MKETILKINFAALGAAAVTYFGVLALPVILLMVVMILDYASGMAWAWVNHSLSSRIGVVGIIKKAGYLLVVASAVAVDWMLNSALVNFGVEDICLFGILVSFWLIINEIISILENLSKLGVPMPGFLRAVLNRLKVTLEEQGEPKNKIEKGMGE